MVRYDRRNDGQHGPKLARYTLVSIENGVATFQAGKGADWLNAQLGRSVARELKLSGYEIEKVIFVE